MAVSANALISLAEAKTHLGITDTANDTLLEALIDGASAAIEAFCQTVFVQRTITDIVAGGPGLRCKRIYLTRYPIVSVTSITDPAANTVPATDYVIYKAEGMLIHAGAWPEAQDSNGNVARWSVVYIAGRAATTAAVEANLKLACKMLVAATFSRRESGIASKRVGDLSVSYHAPSAEGGGMPPEVASLLAPYVSIGF